MDSLTHLFVGGAIAAAIAPASQRRAALLAGAALNSLPDLDVLPLLFSDNPVVRMTWHRAATHSLLLLPLVGLALWLWFRNRGGRVAAAPQRWFWIFQCALLSHPLLDACTVYGTQLLWPLPVSPAMWSTLFIIDPLFVLPLLLGCLVAWFARERVLAQRALVAALLLAVGYLGWSFAAKAQVDRAVERVLARQQMPQAPYFTVPTPFNTLRWRVVVMTPQGFMEGECSPRACSEQLSFTTYNSDATLLATAKELPAGARLLWFNHHFAKAEERDGELVLTDLRMGDEPDYVFRFAIARRDGDGWNEIAPEDVNRRNTRQALRTLWRRLWASDEAPPHPRKG
jgi:inner membrane protein